jgi:hypothetical protein
MRVNDDVRIWFVILASFLLGVSLICWAGVASAEGTFTIYETRDVVRAKPMPTGAAPVSPGVTMPVESKEVGSGAVGVSTGKEMPDRMWRTAQPMSLDEFRAKKVKRGVGSGHSSVRSGHAGVGRGHAGVATPHR